MTRRHGDAETRRQGEIASPRRPIPASPRPAVRIGIIGDYDPVNKPHHRATNEAIQQAANSLQIDVGIEWLATESLVMPTSELSQGRHTGLPLQNDSRLESFDGLWASSGSPYKSMDGALRAIRYAREQNVPFIGT